ncbi:MAG: SURF1 family protein [Gammaproteobacteria bacterium]|nr:SURF1 family protein [Gammaproteobacteria bacterium]
MSNSRSSPNVFLSLLAIIIVAGLTALGFWQLQRADEKRALFKQFSDGADYSISLQALLQLPITAEAKRYRQVSVIGYWQTSGNIVLDNMSHDGAPGYQVMSPLCCVADKLVMINRGWIPWRDRSDAFNDVALKQSRPQKISGRWVSLPKPGLRLSGDSKLSPAMDKTTTILSFPTADQIAQTVGKPVHDGMLWLDPDQAEGFVRDWQVSAMPPERHVGYAVQWFALALTLIVIYIILVFRKRKY